MNSKTIRNVIVVTLVYLVGVLLYSGGFNIPQADRVSITACYASIMVFTIVISIVVQGNE